MENGTCKNCGADYELHQYETLKCPKHGIEENRFDRIEGKYYPQRWEETVFDGSEKVDIEALQKQNAMLLEALEALYKEIGSRFIGKDEAIESGFDFMGHDLKITMQNANAAITAAKQ